jgi:hypothetical protein
MSWRFPTFKRENINPEELCTSNDRERCLEFRELFEAACYRAERQCKERFLNSQRISKTRVPLTLLLREWEVVQ